MDPLEQQLAGLSPEQRRIVELWLRQERAKAIATPQSSPIPRRVATGAAPLSFAQQRLWFLHQLEPRSPASNLQTAARLTGRLDVAALERSLDALMERHEALRSTFCTEDGQPRQVVAPAAHIPLALVALDHLPPGEQDAQARQLALQESAQPFDLEHGPLLRVHLLRLAADEHILLLTTHQIVCDEWSWEVLIRDLATLYGAASTGQPASLPLLPVQYADFATWQRERLQGSGVWDQGSGVRGHGDTETRRQGDKEIRPSTETRPPSPNTQHPTPIQAQLDYWRRQLADAPAVLDLPADHPLPPSPTFRGARRPLTLEPELAAALDGGSERAGIARFVTLLAAFQVLMHRLSGQDDIVVGTRLAGRTRPELEGLAGCFANTLVLRTNLAGNPRFAELLDRVYEVTQAACAHQDLPFEALVEALRPGRDLNRTPLFQVLFQVEDAPLPAIESGGLSLAAWEIERATTQFDLALIVRACAQGPSVAIEYACDLFEATTIERMIGHFQVLLHGIVAAPDRRLAELPLLTDAEREQLSAWNATQVEFRSQESGVRSAALCIHDLFEAQVARTPDAVALVFDRPTTNDQRPTTTAETRRQGDKETRRQKGRLSPQSSVLSPQSLTYDELNQRANQLAHHLRALGVGPEVRVAVCLERSIELIVALLGVLKAGGAYLPMDPAYPQERLAFMLEDARVAVLITATEEPDKETRRHGDTETRGHGDKALQEPRAENQEPQDSNNQEPGTHDELKTQNSKLKTQNSTPSPLHLVTLSGSWPAISLCTADDPVGTLDPTNLAYVIYTSGSTGVPKGVAVPHGGLLNLVFWHQRAYGLSAADRATHLAGLAFDAAVWEVWPALAAGASVALADEATRTTPARLRDWLLEQAITISFLPTPLAEAVLRLEWPARAALRAMLTGGDQLRHYPRAGLPFALLNHYGPTEASVVATAGAVPAVAAAERLPAIGRPIANTQVYLLDRYLQPVPVGVAGELYIGGAGLARGYLSRPDLTAERFIPNPFAGVLGDGCWVTGAESSNTRHPTPVTRLYKTGDLARYRPDGMIEFLGRIDDQVKVRGFRIELGEVELALRRHPDVREAVVVAREDTPGDKRLVAYIVPTNDQRPTTNDQRASMLDSSSVLSPQSSVLRTFLKDKLPDYMVPSAFVLLDALPLTPHGKIDRRALPAPESVGMEKPFVAPRTPIEERLAQIWAEVLDMARVGVHDDFFALGGHSLQATQLLSRVRESFQIELPLRSMFEAPTIAALAERIMVVQREQPGVLAPKLAPAGRDHALPLSFAQQRLWFIDQLQPFSPVYNIPSCVRMSGSLDRQALRRSLAEIVRRHEALRTTFAAQDGQPVQVIRPPEALPLPLIDLQALPEDTREDVALGLAGIQARRPFDLARGPLLRCLLLWLGRDEHILVLTMHHIVSDGWSMGVFIRELTALYTAFAAGRPSPLPPLPVQYADFAIWQRGWLQGAVLERQLAYWRHQLREPLAVLELPTARPRPPVQTFRGAVVRFTISQPLTEALKALSRRAGATLYMTFLAALKTLFYHYTGQEDISIGSSIANRNWEGYEGLIGFFVNTLVMRTDLSGNPPFRELLGRVRQVALSAYDHQDVPFEKLAEDLRPNRDPSYTPWFQVLFVLQNAPLPALEVAGLTLRTMGIDSGTAKFDMTLSLFDAPLGMRGTWMYNTDLFDATTIERMTGHFLVLLESIVANPDQRLADLALMTEAERDQMLVGWNATAAQYPTDVCIHELIAAQAARTPDAVAIVFDCPSQRQGDKETRRQGDREHRDAVLSPQSSVLSPQSLTYRELNERANQLAQYLRSLGVGPEVRVGVCLERSPELIVGVLGALKAGGAYVPLDPTYPAERLAFIVADAGVGVLLTTTDQRPTTNDQRPTTNDHPVTPSPSHPLTPSPLHPLTPSPCHLVSLSGSWPTIARCAPDAPSGALDPANLAYVIYTSGSLGVPKGVLVPHRALVNYTLAAAQNYALTAADHVLQFASISFDASAEEIYPTLISGATLVLRSESMLDTPAIFLQACREWRLNVLSLPTVYWHEISARLGDAGVTLPSCVRLLIIGGERALPERLALWREHAPAHVRLINTYGPTEATIVATIHDLSRVEASAHPLREVPIGRPVQNARAYILDRHLRPTLTGVPGELHLGGAGLARGYLDRPDLTAERFIPNPFGEVLGVGCWVLEDSAPVTQHPTPNTRLYKTGDLACYLADGTIAFMGRIDDQVKVRGFRIELGEIETVLGQHPAVRECVVLAREDLPGERRLVAYVVTTNDQRPTTNDQHDRSSQPSFVVRRSSFVNVLRGFLRERLPEYMVPSAFVLLDSLPLTPSGKVDRRALPAPDARHTTANKAYIAPRTPIEEVVAGAWADVLGVTQVGVDDNFFALGGHSLLAIQVVARLRATFQIELPVRTLFEAPTVALLAAHLDRSRRALMGLQAPAIRPRAWAETAPLSFAQQRLWFLDQLVPGTATYNLPLSVRLRGALDVAALTHSLNEIVRRHEALRTTFATLDGQPVQVIAPPAPRPLTVVDLQALPTDEREAGTALLTADEAQRPFDLAHGPLMRVALVRLEDQQHLVLLNMHHIIADAWSMGVLLRELATLYSAFAAGQPAHLPELPVQYADYAVWQQQWLQGSGVWGLGSEIRETRRQGDKETRSSGPQHPTPNTQHPTPIETQLAYWRAQLAGLPPLDLPIDHPRPALQTSHGAQHPLVVSSSLRAALVALSRREDVTLFMTLLAAFQGLLARSSGQNDILVGAPIAGRTQRELEELIGFFVNTLVLRSDLSGNPPFRELLARVREVCLGAYAHQDLPFEKLVEELHPARDLSRAPLVQVLFALQNAPLPALELPGLVLSPEPVASRTAKFDLALSLAETSEGLVGTWEYSTDLFEAATIQRLSEHFQVLLEGIVADPEQRLADLPLLTDAERQLLTTWNDTQAAYPQDVCLHDLFAAQAARTPDAVAVVFDGPGARGLGSGVRSQRDKETGRQGDQETRRQKDGLSPQSSVLSPEQLTYHKLNARANQLAHYLQQLGVGPEVLVGICLERSLQLVVALLGVLKSGGAYVPLDPAYPPERLDFMLEDAQVAVLLTTNDQRPRTNDQRPAANDLRPATCDRNPKSKIVNLDADWPTVATGRTDNPSDPVAPDQLAYVIYTSGSTGRPKGAMNTHRAVCNRLLWMQEVYQLTPADNILQKTPFSFDVSVWEFFWPLLAGAQLVLARPGGHQDSAYMVELIASHAITTLHFVPSMLELILDEPGLVACTSVKRVICSGEALSLQLQERFFSRWGAQLYNLYGPTEAAIDVTFWPCERETSRHSVPIGRPVANTQIYLLDPWLQPVPIGVSGELYIGGVQLARGYLSRPELTAEHFIPNPFGEVLGVGCRVSGAGSSNTQHPTPNTRLYRTGDRARYRADGTIEYLGRLDQQVKVRGFRIEPGEIETVLTQHPAVWECVVMAREDVPGDMRLVAYLVTADKSQVTSSSDSSLVTRHSSLVTELRAFLAERLPDYMVPSAFVVLEALPLTPNGKLDRRALPAPDATRPGQEMPFRAPHTPVEEVVAGIWGAILGVAQVGVDDNFFALGGHSLLATQVVARLREVFQVEVPVRVLFEAPTVAGLAARLDRGRSALSGLQAPPLRPHARARRTPLSFAQQRLWFLDRLQPGLPTYNIPSVVRLTGALDLAALHTGLSEIVRRHETLRTSFVSADGLPMQVLAPPARHPLPLLDLQALPEAVRAETTQRLAEAEAAQPFDLSRGPLLRTTLLRLDVAEHVLLLTLHHIIADGWSLGVLLRELATLYAAYSAGQPAALPALPVQYADYALWQQQWLQGAVLEQQLAYWKGQLGGPLPVLELPTDRPRPPVQTFCGAQHTMVISPTLTAALVALNRQEGVTLFMTLLAAFAVLLARSSGQDDLLVGTPIANRTQRELEGLIGFFVNTLVLRTDLGDNPPFRVLLARVREVCLHAYAHQDLPFERLVEALQPERDLSRAPLIQAMLAVQNAPLPALALPGLMLHPEPVASQTAKFDLALAVNETAAGLVGVWEYNTDLFEAATISRMSAHFQVLLEGIVAAPAQRVAELPLLTDAERELLRSWNATEARFPQHASIHALVAAQTERTPDAVAILFDGPSQRHGDTETRRHGDKEHRDAALSPQSSVLSPQSLTYTELNERANRLAHHLRALGVGPEVRVGVCVERSLELVIALLSVLKASGAYVPLDPAYPTERLAFMLEDAQVAVLLTTGETDKETRRQGDKEIGGLPLSLSPGLLVSPAVVDLCADWSTVAAAPPGNPPCHTTPDNLAYVIYTSGSTGRPKGAAITHQSAVAFISWAQTVFSTQEVAGVLAATSICFDLSVFELFVTLSSGGSVILAENALALPTLPAAQSVTLINTVPSAMRELVRSGSVPPSVRTVNLAGEPLSRELAQAVYAQTGVQAVYNLYGPTEDTTYSTYSLVLPDSTVAPAIGRPIANSQAYVLDAQLRVVPIGVPGELYLGGAGQARGYLNRPDLTAERFVPNPFAGVLGVGCWVPGAGSSNTQHPTPDTRLYRTGDLARYRADGELEFLGRVDQQIKLRGFRIEPGEIETLMRQHPAVRACAVLAREDAAGDRRLVAYVVPKIEDRGLKIEDSGSSAPDPLSSILYPLSSELRGFLQTRLPDYMIPSAFVVLDTLPLTPNGKLDRRALPAPETTRAVQAASYLAPRDTLELVLVQLWEALLGVAPVGVHDNFFALGGHSLLVVRLLARIQTQFGQSLPLATFFQAPTVAQLADWLRQQGGAQRPSPLVAIQPTGSKYPFFCVHAGAGTVLCYVELARQLGAEQPFYAFQAAGLEDDQPPLTRVEDMAAAYLAALREVQPAGPYLLGGWSFGGLVAFEMAQQLHAQGEEVALLALIDSAAPAADAADVGDPNAGRAEENDVALLAGFARDLARQGGIELTISAGAALRELAPEQRLRWVLDQARAAGILPPGIDEQQIRRARDVFAANWAALRQYRPRAYTGPVTLFRAVDPALVADQDAALGWGAWAEQGVAVHTIPGDHYSLVRAPQVALLAAQLDTCIDAAQTHHGSKLRGKGRW